MGFRDGEAPRDLQNIGRYRRMMSYVRIAQYERHTPTQGAGLPGVRSHPQATRELNGIEFLAPNPCGGHDAVAFASFRPDGYW